MNGKRNRTILNDGRKWGEALHDSVRKIEWEIFSKYNIHMMCGSILMLEQIFSVEKNSKRSKWVMHRMGKNEHFCLLIEWIKLIYPISLGTSKLEWMRFYDYRQIPNTQVNKYQLALAVMHESMLLPISAALWILILMQVGVIVSSLSSYLSSTHLLLKLFPHS